MAVLLDKLSQRNTLRSTPAELNQASPLPTINQTISTPPVRVPSASINQRVSQLSERGPVGSLPQFNGVQKKFVADLPTNVQIQGIQEIINGQDSTSPIVNNFVRGMAAKGAQPEQIRQAFIEQQKNSANPLALA